jgi:hypothetical protein
MQKINFYVQNNTLTNRNEKMRVNMDIRVRPIKLRDSEEWITLFSINTLRIETKLNISFEIMKVIPRSITYFLIKTWDMEMFRDAKWDDFCMLRNW